MSYFIELNDLMSRYGFQPDKKMAQFFIMDEVVVAKLVELAELKKTDVVLEIGGARVVSLEHYREVVKSLKKGEIVRLLVKRGRASIYLAFPLG